jgi:hypothetical protein
MQDSCKAYVVQHLTQWGLHVCGSLLSSDYVSCCVCVCSLRDCVFCCVCACVQVDAAIAPFLLRLRVLEGLTGYKVPSGNLGTQP